MRVGIIGLGFMGGVHLQNWQGIDGVEVVAVCDANPIQKKATQGNLDVSDDELNLDGVTIYTEVAAMLEAENLDAVSITLPTHLHKPISIQCLEAGVHVLCEKPMALSVEDCDCMIAAAQAADRQLMVAHCIRFWPEYAWVKQCVEGGEYGKVLAAEFSRYTYAPGWTDGSWVADPAKSGGLSLDLHIHDLDFIQYLFGAPEKITSKQAHFENGVPGHVVTMLEYPENLVVSAGASWMMPNSFGFKMAMTLVFEKASVVFDSHLEKPLTVYPAEGEVFEPAIEAGDGYKGEVEYFAQLIAGTEAVNTILPPEQSRESVRMALEALK
jgi:predicted dehydrogenase